MTALALVGGIFPLVIATGAGAGARNSLGNTILGGIIASTILSLFIIPVFFSLAALTFSPALCAFMLKPLQEKTRGLFGIFNRVINKFRDMCLYLCDILERRWGLLLVCFAALLFCTYWLYEKVPQGFLPSEDKGVIYIAVQTPPGTSLNKTTEIS